MNIDSNRNKQKLPDVKFRPGTPERLMEAAALLIVVATWIYIICMNHINEGDKFVDALVGGIVTTVTFAFVALCAYAPVKLINFPFRPTPQNIAGQYVLAVRFIRIINITMSLCMMSCTMLVYHTWAEIIMWASIALMIVETTIYIIIAKLRS